MSTRLASWSLRADGRLPLAAGTAGAALFALSWAIVHAHVFTRHEIVDTPLYARYGDAIVGGAVPYRDFALEYPPGALPVFALPALGADDSYRTLFELLMLACGLGAIVLVVTILTSLGATAARAVAAVGFVALTPLALGPVVLTRYDLWPAALTAGALAALVAGRARLGLGALAVAAAAKIYPLVLLPVAFAYVWAVKGRREALTALAVFVWAFAAIVAPFALLAAGGLGHSLHAQTGRPLQIESLGAALLLAAHRLGAYQPTVVSSFGSQNLAGALPDAFAAAQTALVAAGVVTVWLLFARSRRGRDDLLLASAAAVTAVVAFSKVVSPQFLIWLPPLVVLVGGDVGIAAGALLAGALVATQGWFPNRYWEVVALRPVGWLVLVRDLLLLALFAVLAASLARRSAAPRSA